MRRGEGGMPSVRVVGADRPVAPTRLRRLSDRLCGFHRTRRLSGHRSFGLTYVGRQECPPHPHTGFLIGGACHCAGRATIDSLLIVAIHALFQCVAELPLSPWERGSGGEGLAPVSPSTRPFR